MAVARQVSRADSRGGVLTRGRDGAARAIAAAGWYERCCPDVSVLREMAPGDWDRVAGDYFEAVVSPLRAGVPRPLARALAGVPDASRKTAGDLGCGIGTLLPALAGRFRRVLAIDFSPAMLAR